jgi:hypothetical protein
MVLGDKMALEESPLDLRNLADFIRKPAIGLHPRKLLNPGDAVFTIGSCFALNVRRALAAGGFATYPNYAGVDYDRTHEIFDQIPKREMPLHYDTFTMRQEFEAALGVWKDRERGYWPVRDALVNQLLKAEEVSQDPYRKLTYATTPQRLGELSNRVTAAVREGLETSRLIVITLGLTEVWQHNETGKYLCRPPTTGYGGGEGRATFRLSTFTENYENVKAMLNLLFTTFPDRHVVLSVSPVRLERTYSNMDVGTANIESKSILRAVAGQISREYPDQVTYYPSFEMAMGGLGALTGTGSVFESDGRHVRQDFVDRVVGTFIAQVT